MSGETARAVLERSLTNLLLEAPESVVADVRAKALAAIEEARREAAPGLLEALRELEAAAWDAHRYTIPRALDGPTEVVMYRLKRAHHAARTVLLKATGSPDALSGGGEAVQQTQNRDEPLKATAPDAGKE